MQKIKNKVVIVTGASAGLGRAIAAAFAEAGAHVGLIAREESTLRDFAAELAHQYNIRTAFAVADMGDGAQVGAGVEILMSQFGACDIWINNAMETVFSPFADMTADEFRRVTEVDYLGFVYGTQQALKIMRARGSGHIIQIGSALAYRSIPLQSAYCGAKAAIRGFTDSLRTELIHDRSPIQLTMVHMPALNTPQFSWARTHIKHHPKPVGTIFQPELGAEAVLHAARYPKREYWVGGSTVAAIIGTMVFPRWMDRQMARMSYEKQWIEGKPIAPRDGNLFAASTAAAHRRHGIFSQVARRHSLTWSVIKNISRVGS